MISYKKSDTDSASLSSSGLASDHFGKQSIQTNECLYPFTSGIFQISTPKQAQKHFAALEKSSFTFLHAQLVIFKPLGYLFEETIGFDIKPSFSSCPVSRLIRWYNKPGDITKEFWEKVPQFHGTFHGLKIFSHIHQHGSKNLSHIFGILSCVSSLMWCRRFGFTAISYTLINAIDNFSSFLFGLNNKSLAFVHKIFTNDSKVFANPSKVFLFITLSLKDPFISESCIEIKTELNFYFRTSLWCLKKFYEGLKGLHKTFWDTTKKCENKNLT